MELVEEKENGFVCWLGLANGTFANTQGVAVVLLEFRLFIMMEKIV